ncbi:MAG: sensor histidine kinase [Candidatus Limnocylindria bacterium]
MTTRDEPGAGDAYTRAPMDAARPEPDAPVDRFAALVAECSAAVASSANTLRSVRDRFRHAYGVESARLAALHSQLEHGEAETGDARVRAARREADRLAAELGRQQAMLTRLELADSTLARTWLFLSSGDASLVDADGPATSSDVAMRIVEAQEAERTRLAQDVHDGSAQALSNAIFQIELIERLAVEDAAAAADELRALKASLRRELVEVREAIHDLRPPELGVGGLAGAIHEAAERLRTVGGPSVTAELTAPDAVLDEGQRVAAVRIVREALQNVRKHAAASTVVISTEQAGDEWLLEVRDDGRGFEVEDMVARGRRNFGLRFMRERAELIGARLDIRSRPDGGSVVRLAIPTSPRQGA